MRAKWDLTACLNTYFSTYVFLSFTLRPWIRHVQNIWQDDQVDKWIKPTDWIRFSIFVFLYTEKKNPSFLFCYVPFQDEFYQQLQAIRQPWHIPSDTDSDILEPPEQDKSEWRPWLFLPLCIYFFLNLTFIVYHLLIQVPCTRVRKHSWLNSVAGSFSEPVSWINSSQISLIAPIMFLPYCRFFFSM